jgi:RND superfamily putative drug exporter
MGRSLRAREFLVRIIGRRPGGVIAAWLAITLVVVLTAPDLTRFLDARETPFLPADCESARAAALVASAWPDRSSASSVVAGLHRPGGLTSADGEYAGRLAAGFRAADRPGPVLSALGPDSAPEVARRLVSRDGTVQLVLVPLATSFISPLSRGAIDWLQARARELPPPPGLEVVWTGDAVIGRDVMRNVRVTLDRAAVTTVVLLLGVLLAVYRSLWLSMIPMLTIGASLLLARGLLAWMALAGWELSCLVELFLVVILFGCGTDLCLLISWRFAELWDPADPGAAMGEALRRAHHALLTSGATVIVGLSLMGVNRFRLFSCTGPSVAIGLALTLLATLTLTPALLIVLARARPRCFDGLRAPSSGVWERIGLRVLARPRLTVALILAAMAPLAALGLSSGVVFDMLEEQPAGTASVQGLRLIAKKFGGAVAPLTVVIEADRDLRQSLGLSLIDDVSRRLAHERRLIEVRSATQPLGSPKPLEPARFDARLGAVRAGLAEIADGGARLKEAIDRKAMALWLEGALTKIATLGKGGKGPDRGTSSRQRMLEDLAHAGSDAARIADGGRRAQEAVATILDDPLGRTLLDHVLITAADLRAHPELKAGLDAYVSGDNRLARIDLVQADPVFSAAALAEVDALRRRLDALLGDADWLRARAMITGVNAQWADIRAQSLADTRQIWVLVPLGVYLVLLAALRDPWSCLNLIATMLLTYAFALGATALVFVHVLGAAGLDWKVPYFLFILLVAVGVDYNVFLMTRLREESAALGLRAGIVRAIGQTGGLISSAAAITACSFAAFLTSPLSSLRQLGFALVVGIAADALIVRPVLVPCGHWLLHRRPRPALRPAIAGGMHPIEHPAAGAERPPSGYPVANLSSRP